MTKGKSGVSSSERSPLHKFQFQQHSGTLVVKPKHIALFALMLCVPLGLKLAVPTLLHQADRARWLEKFYPHNQSLDTVESIQNGILRLKKPTGEVVRVKLAGLVLDKPWQSQAEGVMAIIPATIRESPSSETLGSLYVLEVALRSGSVTEKFLKKHPQVIRAIEIRSDQTLAELHAIIFRAFDREEEHFYEFQLKGNRPNDPNADRYGLPSPLQDESD
ncbi:hypothetical protein IQ250_14345 [Pseudanabaenaceae cyanobacterium LEGE 13415]|nr:hypothetical protein [Pseudanabaenaceae cyanobacterium LEGE 13415]